MLECISFRPSWDGQHYWWLFCLPQLLVVVYVLSRALQQLSQCLSVIPVVFHIDHNMSLSFVEAQQPGTRTRQNTVNA